MCCVNPKNMSAKPKACLLTVDLWGGPPPTLHRLNFDILDFSPEAQHKVNNGKELSWGGFALGEVGIPLSNS